MLSNVEKQYIAHIANLIKDNKPVPEYPITHVIGRSIKDLEDARLIYGSIFNKK